jgi:hypothetical protein
MRSVSEEEAGRSILLACIGRRRIRRLRARPRQQRVEFEQEPIPMAPVPVPEDEDVCCRGSDGLVRIMFLSECRQSRGKAVERKTCAAALKPVAASASACLTGRTPRAATSGAAPSSTRCPAAPSTI